VQAAVPSGEVPPRQGQDVRPAPAASVRLETRAAADRVTIEIRDRGVGIAPDDMARIFDPYFTTRRTGTGLGLPIAKNIIEGLGGSLAVSSRRGEGTDVRIDLPYPSTGAAA
jgi:signal transduction histidine kinase